MDAFFASVEQMLNPALKGRPVIVGYAHRGVVCAASYEARVFGVRSAMPSARARKLCPQGVFVPPRHGVYGEISARVMAVFRSFSPVVEQASIDEAYIDATGLGGLFGSPAELGRKIKSAVFAETGLTCSVGIAPVKFLAKIASDMNKPDGLFILEPAQIADFMRSLPVSKIPGVGPRTQEILAKLGVRTAGEISRLPPGILEARLGKFGESIARRALGLDSSVVEPAGLPKSEGREHTLDKDSIDKVFLKRYLLYQSEKVMAGVRKMGTAGRTVTLKVKFADFRQITRSYTFDSPTTSTRLVYNTACALLDKLELALPVRLIGVSLSNFNWEDPPHYVDKRLLPGLESYFKQFIKNDGVNLENPFSAGTFTLSHVQTDKAVLKRDAALDSAIDKVREMFGREMLKRADLLSPLAEEGEGDE